MGFITKKKYYSTFHLIVVGFLSVILMGTLLLMLPVSTVEGETTSFGDALFTATSATCVTGLVVYDTAMHWTLFGKFVILSLIQIGGIGVITLAIFIAMLSGRKISLMQRSTMQEAIAAHDIGGIVRLTGFLLKITALVELIGAILMYPIFYSEFGVLKGIGYSLFHSISAFCNAGFDLMGVKGQFSSLTYYGDVPLINIIIMLLIIIGGIGFSTWNDIKDNKLHIKRYRLQSKVILTFSFLFIVVPAIYFYFIEFSRSVWGELSVGERILNSLFASVSPRTAGFNTVDLTNFSSVSQLITILLMLTGGAPGSTAGGMKVTTVAVIIFCAFSTFRRKEDVQCFKRRIESDTIKNAVAVLFLYVVMFLAGGIAISLIENKSLMECLFETASAVGTVGLTLGITPQLGAVSKCILIVLMFLGRVGGLTLAFAAMTGKHGNVSKLPCEKITVG